MWILIIDGMFVDSIGDIFQEIFRSTHAFQRIAGSVIFRLLVLLTNVTVMNMLVGVLCEVVSVVAATGQDDAAIKVMKASVLLDLKRFEVYSNGKITTKELSVFVKGLIGAVKAMLGIMVFLVMIIFAMGLFCMSLVKVDA